MVRVLSHLFSGNKISKISVRLCFKSIRYDRNLHDRVMLLRLETNDGDGQGVCMYVCILILLRVVMYNHWHFSTLALGATNSQ